jgi:hypothetical protein
MVCICPRMSLRGVIATKQSQNEIATPFGLAMTSLFLVQNVTYFVLSAIII